MLGAPYDGVRRADSVALWLIPGVLTGDSRPQGDESPTFVATA